MIRKHHNHTLQTNPRHREEELQDTRKTNKVKPPARSLFPSSLSLPIKMIAKLERAQSNVQQNMEQNTEPHNGNKNQQRINSNRAAALERPIPSKNHYSENVSIHAFDNNTRLENKFTSMLNNTGISFYIVSI